MNELVKVDPKEFGLEEENVAVIVEAFKPKIAERDGLFEVYKRLITCEITEDLCQEAGDLRRKLVKVRTGISAVHKIQKAYFLASGKYVDAWKNKETLPVEQMEEKLSEIEKHYENLEKERLENLDAERAELCIPYVADISLILPDLGTMPVVLWDNYIIGLKASFEAKKAEDKRIEDKRLETERITELHNERKNSILPYWIFVPSEHKEDDYGKLTESEWKERFDWTVNKKGEYDKEQEAIRLENVRLHNEAKEKEARNKKRNDELKGYIVFIRDYDALLNSEEKEYQKQFSDIKKGAELQWDYDRKEIKRKAAQEQKDREEKEKLQNKLRIKEQNEQKAIEQAEALKQSELSKGDSEKVKDLINDLTVLKTKYSFKSAKNAKMYIQVNELLDKVINHIEK